MKRFRKFLFMTFGLLMICLTLALVNHNVNSQNTNNDSTSNVSSTTKPDFMKVDGFLGGIRAVYTREELFEYQSNPEYITELSDIIPNADGSLTFYITFYLVVEYGTNGYTFEFDVASCGGTVELLGYPDMIEELYELVDAEEASEEEEEYYNTYLKSIRSKAAYRKFSVTNTCGGGYLVMTGYQSKGNVVTGNKDNSPYDFFLEKVKVTLPAGTTKFEMNCTSADRGDGGDNPNGISTSITDPAKLQGVSISIGAGSVSDSTTTVGTWTGGGSYSTVDFVADHDAHTLTANIPAEWPTEYINYSFTVDGGKGSYTLSGSGVDSTNSKVKIPAKGSTSTLTLTATAAAGNSQAYQVKLVRRSSDVAGLTLKGNGTEQYSLTDFTYNANDLVYTMVSGKQVKWDNTSASLAVSLQNKDTQKLKIEGANASHNSGISYTLGAVSASDTPHEIEFTITEYGHTSTYKVEFERAKGATDVDINGIVIWNDSESNSLSLSGPMNESGVYVYTISDSLKSSVTSLNFKVNLKDKDTQTIVYKGSNWDGTSGKTFDTTGSDNGSCYDFFMTFEVKPQVGTSRTYKVVGVREYSKNSTTTITGTWQGNNSGQAVTLDVNDTNKTINITLPANFTSNSITLNMKTDNGLGSNSINGVGWSGNTLSSLPLPGSNVTAEVTSVAQDGETTVKYNLTVSRRSSDFSNVTLTGKSSESFGSSDLIYNSVDQTYTLTSKKLAWDNTTAGLSVKLADSKQKLYIEDTSYASASKYNYNLGNPEDYEKDYTIKFKIEEADGSSSEYFVKFTRAAGSSEAGVNSVNVYYTNPSDNYNVTGPNASNEFIITDVLPFAHKNVNFTVSLKDSTATITKVGSSTVSWDGTAAKQFTTGNPNNTADEPFSISFVVTPQVGSPVTYTISGTREFEKAISTATDGEWQGNLEAAGVDLKENHSLRTLEGTIPADYSSTYITVSLVTDNGKGSNSLTGLTGTWTGNVVVTPGLGESVKAKVTAVAQDGTTTVEYTLTLTRRSEDFNNLVLKSKDKEGNDRQTFALSDLSYDPSTNTYTLPAGTTLPWDVTNVDLSLNLSDPSSQTLKINGSSASSGVVKNVSLGDSTTSVDNKSVTFTITENGVTKTYTIKFDRDAGDSTTTIDGIKVWFDDETSPYNVTYNGINGNNYYEYKITDVIPYKNTELNFQVLLSETSTQHIVYTHGTTTESSWDGLTPSMPLSTGTLGNSNDYNFAVKFEVHPQVGSPVTYVITGTRQKAAREFGITGELIGSTLQEDNTYKKYQFGAGSDRPSSKTYVIVVDEDYVYFDLSVHSTSTLYFGAGTSKPTEKWSEIPPTRQYAVGDYDNAEIYTALVVAESGEEFYHEFQLKRKDNRSGETRLKELTLKVGTTTLVPRVSETDPTSTTFDKDTYTYYYSIPYKYESITKIDITASPLDAQSKGIYDGSLTVYANLQISIDDLAEKSSGTKNEFYFNVKSEAGTFDKTYKVVIIRADGRDDAYISNLKASDGVNPDSTVSTGTNDPSGTKYNAFVGYNATQATVSFTVADGAKANITSPQVVTITNHVGSFTVSVTSEKGTTKNYSIYVYATERDADIKKIRLLDYDKSYDVDNNKLSSTLYDLVDENGDLVYDFNVNDYNNPIQITVPYTVKNIYMHATSNKQYAVFQGLGAYELQPGVKRTITVYSVSHYSTLNSAVTEESEKYVFEITRERASTEDRIDSITAYYGLIASTDKLINSDNISFDPDLPGITISNFDLENYSDITLYIKLKDPVKSKLRVDGNYIAPNNSGVCIVPLSLLFSDGKALKTLMVYPEDGQPNEYYLTVSSSAKVDPVMPVITSVMINGVVYGDDYLSGVTLQPTNSITIDKNENKVVVTVSVSGTEGSYAIEFLEVDATTYQKVVGDKANVNTYVGKTIIKVYPFTTKEAGTAYEFELTRQEPSKVNTINGIEIDGEGKTPTANTETVYDVPAGTTSVQIKITPDDPTSTVVVILPDGTELEVDNIDPATGEITGTIPGLTPGDNKVTIKVKAEDATIPEIMYPINVKVDQPTALKELSVTNLDGDVTYEMTGTSPVYTVKIPHDVNYVNIDYVLPDGVKENEIIVSNAGTVRVEASCTHSVIVSTVSGATNPTTYTIKFEKEQAKVGNDLLTVEIQIPDNNSDGTPEVIQVDGFVSSKKTYDVILPANTLSYEFINVTVSDGASYQLDSNLTLTNNAKNERKIVVKSESGLDNTYSFNLYVANTECEIIYIKAYTTGANSTELIDLDNKTLTFNAAVDHYELRVANSVSTIKLEIKYSVTSSLSYSYDGTTIYNGGLSKITVSLDNVGATNPNEIAVQALSQLYNLDNTLGATHVSVPYDIKIVREDLDGDNSLSKLELHVGNIDKIVDFESTNYEYVVDELGNVATVRLVAETTSAKAKISSISTVSSSAVNQRTFDGTIALNGILNTSLTATIVVTVTAENGRTQDYQVIVSRGAIEPDKDNTVYDITLIDNTDPLTSHISFVESTNIYPVTIPTGVSYYTINAAKLNGSYATMYITLDNGTVLSTNGNYTENITQDQWGKTIKYYVYAMAQDTSVGKGTQYTIEVKIDKPSDVTTLNSLKVDGQELITTENPTGPYSLAVPYDTSSVHIYAETTHENATIKVGTVKVGNIYSQNANLKVGTTTITVEICAEDGITYGQYEIEITRAAEAPKLDTLEVSGTYLRDEFNNRIPFDPEETHYYVVVPYEKEEVEIIATSSAGTVNGTGIRPVNVGTQDFTVQVVGANGMSTNYIVTVLRYPESYSNSFAEYIKIAEIKDLDSEFKPTKTSGYSFTVPNKVTDLNVSVLLQFVDDNTKDDVEATYDVYGDKDLRVGLNNVAVVVKSADGTSETTYLIQVNREAKQYDVNNNNEAVKSFELEQKVDKNGAPIHNEFIVDIGAKKTSEVDFSNFIENLNPANQELDITVITDTSTNPDEVVVRITDGDETEFVKFQVKSTGNPTGFQGEEWTFLLLLGIILIILLAILFTVNKDKYGKITKKTNRRNERKEKKEDAKRK